MAKHETHRRRYLRAVSAIAAVGVVAVPVAAAAAPATSGHRGSAVFTFAKETNGSDTAPAVAALADGSARVAWIDYDTNPVGVLMTCLIKRGAGKCGDTASLGTVETTNAPEPTSGSEPIVLAGANGELVILAGELATYAYISLNNGQTFAPPVAISTTVDATAAQFAADGRNVILAGGGNDAQAGTLHLVEVSLDGDNLTSPPVIESSDGGAVDNSFGLYKGQTILASTPINTNRVVFYKLAAGADANAVSSWTPGAISGVSLPSLATTSKGLVLGAERETKSATYPEALTYNGTTFAHAARLQKSFGQMSFVTAGGSTSPEGKSRYTVTWNIVGGETSNYAYYSSSSSDGKHWVTKRIAGQTGAVVQSTEASISPDGGGLVVQDFHPSLRAIRLYVGTVLSAKPKPARVTSGRKVTIRGKLVTDLGVPVPKVKLTYSAGGASHKVTTSKKGTYKITVHPSKSEKVTVSYAGTNLFDPSSKKAKLSVTG